MQCNVRRCCLRTREAARQTVVVTRRVTCVTCINQGQGQWNTSSARGSLVLTLCSATTSATHFLPASVILRSGCWENEWTTSSWVDNTGRQKCELWCCEQDITGKPHSIEFCFTRKLNFSKLLYSLFRKVISLWDLKITFILIKCISCTGNQFTLSPTNKKRDQQKDRPS